MARYLDQLELEQRLPYVLEPQWDLRIVALSWCCSFLASFSTAVLTSQATMSRRPAARLAWLFSASLCFGFGAIFAMHFVGMMAANVGVAVTFHPGWTALSAFVAVLFSFLALTVVSFHDFLPKARNSSTDAEKSGDGKKSSIKQRVTSYLSRPDSRRPSLADIEADEDRQPLLADNSYEASEGTSRPMSSPGNVRTCSPSLASTTTKRMPLQTDRRLSAISPGSIAPFASANTPPPLASSSGELATPPALLETPPERNLSLAGPPTGASMPRKLSALRNSSASLPTVRSPASSRAASEVSESTDSISGSKSDSLTTSGASSPSWLDSFLPPAARVRLKKGESYKAEHWTTYVVRRLRAGLSPVYVGSAVVYASAVVAMHYIGMIAMRSRSGELQIQFNVYLVVLSAFIAFIDTFIALIFLIELESAILRQGAFALVAASGVCAMHYTGQRAATYRSSVPSDYAVGSYPPELIATVVIVSITISLISNTILAYMATLSRDRLAENVTIKRRAWRLVAQKEAAEQANALKSDFISTASHELRTPLHTVSGYTELLCRTHLTEEQKLYLESIRRACHQLHLMTRSVLDFSKLERGGDEYALPEFVNLRETIVNVAELCEERRGALNVSEARAGEVQLLIDIDASAPHAVFTDEVFLSRIATNLLGNALKFCAAPGYVSLTVTYEEGHLILVISDAGIGIAAKFLPALFEPFTQADSSLTRRHAGTGLGLAIVSQGFLLSLPLETIAESNYQLVARLKGTITVKSQEGHGTTFTVSLPIDQIQRDEEDTDMRQTSKGTLAIFCLHPDTRTAVGDMWRKYGWQIVERSVDDPVSYFETPTLIWTEALALEAHPALLHRMNTESEGFDVPVLVPYADDATLAEHMQIFTSPCVVKLKMPLIAHKLADLMSDPRPHMQRNAKHSERPKLVRFASAVDSEDTMVSTFDGPSLASSQSSMPSIASPPPKAGLSLEDSTAHESSMRRSGSSSSRAAADGKRGGSRPNILLVEDNPINAKLGERILRSIGFECLLATNGQEAVDACLARSDVDLVLMDLQMPVKDGLQATREIRAHEASGRLSLRLPIIALTANVEAHDDCREAGLDDVLSKPLRISDLERALQRHLQLSPRLVYSPPV